MLAACPRAGALPPKHPAPPECGGDSADNEPLLVVCARVCGCDTALGLAGHGGGSGSWGVPLTSERSQPRRHRPALVALGVPRTGPALWGCSPPGNRAGLGKEQERLSSGTAPGKRGAAWVA